MANLRAKTTRQGSRQSSVQSQKSNQISISSQPPTRRSQRLQSRDRSVGRDSLFEEENNEIRSEQPEARRRVQHKHDLAVVQEVTTINTSEDGALRNADENQDKSQVVGMEEEGDDSLESRETSLQQLPDTKSLETNAVASSPVPSLPSSLASSSVVSKSEELGMMKENASSMIDQLPDLFSAANSLLEPLIPEQITMNTVDRISLDVAKNRTKWERRHDSLMSIVREYSDVLFIDPKLIVPVVVNLDSFEEVRDAAWRPDDVVFLANLAQFAYRLMNDWSDSSVAKRDWLSAVDSQFPAQFMHGVMKRNSEKLVPVGFSQLHGDTLDLGLEIRTQLLLAVLEVNPQTAKSEELIMIKEAFLTREARGQEIENLNQLLSAEMKEWQVPGLEVDPTGTTDAVVQRTISERVEQILKCLRPDHVGSSNQEYAVGFPQLNDVFPYAVMRLSCMQWIHERFNELQMSIRSRGGVREITKHLENTGDPRKSPQKIDVKGTVSTNIDTQTLANEYIIDPSTDTFSKQNPDALRSLKRISAMVANSTPPAAQRPSTQRTSVAVNTEDQTLGMPMDDANRAGSSDDEDMVIVEPIIVSLPGKKLLNQPQKGARRVSPIREDDDSDFEDREMQDTSPGRKRKRDALRLKNDEAARRKQAKGHATRAAAVPDETSIRPTRPVGDEDGDGDGDWQPGNDENEDDTDHENEAGAEKTVSYSQIAEAARKYRAPRKPVGEPQRRKAWTDEESSELIRLIYLEDCSYAAIKRYDCDHKRILLDRSQGDLKDRAKIMKKNYLIARRSLPSGFERVLLDKKQKTDLELRGIVYEQDQVRKARAEYE